MTSPLERLLPAALEERDSSSQARQISSARYSIWVASRSVAEVCSAVSARSSGGASSPWPSSRSKRAVDDEVGIAPDRRGEVAVRGARQARMAEVARVVVRLLQSARRTSAGNASAPRADFCDVVRDALARRGRERARPRPGPSSRRRATGGVGTPRSVSFASRSCTDCGSGARARGRAPRAGGRRGTRRRPRSRGSSAPRRARARAASVSK